MDGRGSKICIANVCKRKEKNQRNDRIWQENNIKLAGISEEDAGVQVQD